MRHVLVAAAATFALAVLATAAVNGSARAGGLGHGLRVSSAALQSNGAPRFTSEGQDRTAPRTATPSSLPR